MNILYLKALHIIFVVTWFAGLFYIVRLFIYHAEAEKKEEPARGILQKQYKLMEKRLWYGITWPSMILTCLFGFWFAYDLFVFNFPGWLLLKLAFVLFLVIYHLQCHRMFLSFQRDKARYSSFSLRLWNEVTTILLFAIVFIVVLRDSGDWFWGAIGLVLISLSLLIAILIYRRNRRLREEAKATRQKTGAQAL